jgi:uncharacterized protein (DUF885 family)
MRRLTEETGIGSPISTRFVVSLRTDGVERYSLAIMRFALIAAICAALSVTPAPATAESGPATNLASLIERVSEVKTQTQSAAEYEAAAAAYREILEQLGKVDREALGPDDEIDAELLEAHARTRLFEIEDLELHKVVPVQYLALSETSGLFLRPCGASVRQIEGAIEELERFPEVVANGLTNLTNPARTWTENAIYTASFAEEMLREDIPALCTDDAEARDRLVAASGPALAALEQFVDFLDAELLPRSTRPPTWTVEQIDFYQLEHERLFDYDSRRMLAVALEEESALLGQMTALAARIHPSGDLSTVWELMKDEAPPWAEVPAMARRYVEMADAWLRGPGAHLVDIPEAFDHGVQITSPMARRLLSFGGASYGPTVAGRISGYYVLTPLEEQLSEDEKASRIRSYNPYWTHVISYHEWLGHNVQRAYAEAHVTRPMRRLFRSSYLSQAWSFYLEKLLEDEGYYDVLPHVEALKTRMARLQMRMWRVQRIITKIRMALGEMTFEEAVEAYVEKLGMERTNAFIEVQRDSQSPSPPGREIIGERVILELRDAYRRRMGEHYQLRHFHEALLRYGELPLPVVGRLMLGD